MCLDARLRLPWICFATDIKKVQIMWVKLSRLSPDGHLELPWVWDMKSQIVYTKQCIQIRPIYASVWLLISDWKHCTQPAILPVNWLIKKKLIYLYLWNLIKLIMVKVCIVYRSHTHTKKNHSIQNELWSLGDLLKIFHNCVSS